jgi:CheY-like chemotaxis protein
MALGGAARILIVEDEPLIAMDLQSRLKDLGYENIYLADDISHAFELLDRVNPEFAILDVNIGCDLVFPVAAKLASRNIPFVFSTGLSQEMLPAEWQSRPLLVKPPKQTALEAAMRSLGLSGTAIAVPVLPLAPGQYLAAGGTGVNPFDGGMGAPATFRVALRADQGIEQNQGQETLGPIGEAGPDVNITDVTRAKGNASELSE